MQMSLQCISGMELMTKDDLNSLAFPAMRYAIGCKTFVVETVCRALTRNAKDIRSDIRYRMSEEIAIEIMNGNANIRPWQDVLTAFEEIKND